MPDDTRYIDLETGEEFLEADLPNDGAITAPARDDVILAVYRVDPGDPEGNARRAQESISRMLAKVVALHTPPTSPSPKNPTAPPGSPPLTPGH